MATTDTPASLASDLRDEALILSGESMRNGCQRCGISASLAVDAADMIERLVAERDAAIARAEAAESARNALAWVAEAAR